MISAKINYHQLVLGEQDVGGPVRKGLGSLLRRQCSVSLAVLFVFILIQNDAWSQVNAPAQKVARFREDRILIKPKAGISPAAQLLYPISKHPEVISRNMAAPQAPAVMK